LFRCSSRSVRLIFCLFLFFFGFAILHLNRASDFKRMRHRCV
jgi:hypothetical protein